MEAEEVLDKVESIQINDNITKEKDNNENVEKTHSKMETDSPDISKILANETLDKIHPKLMKVKPQLKELIAKQNKIYLDISAEKFKYTDSNICSVEHMMEKVKYYREKLVKIKKSMIEIHHRSKSLKARAMNIKRVMELRELKNQQQKD